MKERVKCKGAQEFSSISSDADSLQEIHAQICDFTNTPGHKHTSLISSCSLISSLCQCTQINICIDIFS